MQNHRIFFIFCRIAGSFTGKRAEFENCAGCTKNEGKFCATFHLVIFLKIWYYIIVKRKRTPTKASGIKRKQIKSFLKKF